MRIDNRTGYRLRDIRKLVVAAFKAEGVSPAMYWIEIAGTSWARIHGIAWLDTGHIRMYIPEHFAADFNQKETHEFAKIFVHEIGHTLGLVHRDQIDYSEIPTPWADGLVLRRKLERPQIPIRERRFANARKKLVEHSRKLKREQNMVRKWRSKVRYYERVLDTAAGGGG